MKLHTLTLSAFGPFPGTETIDFDALSEDGLFLLHGRTGSGKTFILDAVTFALYGQVAGERGVTRLRSDHAAPGAVPRVILEFTLSGRRYRVTRSPQHMRPKQRGQGYIQENQKAHLEVHESGAWSPAANGPQAVGKELGEVLTLDRHQFTKVILLPQGDFAEFLHSSSNEKQQLLERLFDTTTFRQLEEHLREQAKEAKAQVEEINREIEAQTAAVLHAAEQLTGMDLSAEPVSSAEEPAETAEEEAEQEAPSLRERISVVAQAQRGALAREAEQAEDDRGRAQEQAAALADRRRQLLRHAEYEQRRQEHERHRSQIVQERESLLLHAEALTVRAWFRSAEKADQEAQTLEEAALRRAEQAQDLLGAQQDIAPRKLVGEQTVEADQLREAQRQLTELQGLLRAQDAQKLEAEQLSALRRGSEIAESIRLHRKALEACTAEHRELTGQIESDEQLLRDPEELEREREAARSEQERIAAQLQLHRQLAEARTAQEAARKTLRQKEVRAQEAAAAHEETLNRHLRGIAAELSGSLAPGEPCLVCGSAEHPRPASRQEDAATRAQVREALSRAEAAAAERTAAQAALDEHAARAAASAEELGEAAELSEDSLRERLLSAQRRADQVEAERGAQRDLQQRLERARASLAEAGGRSIEAQAALTLARSEQERAAEDAERIEATLTELRGPHASVQERVRVLQRLEEALAGAEAARHGAAQAGHRAQAAEQEAEQRLSESGFEDQQALRAALLEEEEHDRRQRRVQDWDRTELSLQEESRLEEVSAGRRRAESGEQIPEEIAVQQAGERSEAAARRHQEAGRSRDRYEDRWEQLVQGLDRLESKTAARQEQLAEQVRRTELADTVNGRGPDNRLGMTLTTFVLAARLERVAEAATRHLQIMSEGRYRLLHDDTKRGGGLQGLELKVTDQHSDEERPTSSLSGGETFMASLAMALGLAEVVQADAGGVSLESLFIDEGFGSLDEETLEHVMAALERLQGEGRRVGVVSHVTEMHRAIPVQLRVIKGLSGSRTQMRLAGRTR